MDRTRIIHECLSGRKTAAMLAREYGIDLLKPEPGSVASQRKTCRSKLAHYLLTIPAMAISQEVSVFDFDEVTYFGIDFSKVGILGADEGDAQFFTAFEGINNLILKEASKYNLEAFGKQVIVGDLSTVFELNNRSREMRILDPGYSVSVEDMHDIVDTYRSEGDTGYGLVITGVAKQSITKQPVYFDRLFPYNPVRT